jgi:DNA uptake protein ComE-like DNA-binding protein
MSSVQSRVLAGLAILALTWTLSAQQKKPAAPPPKVDINSALQVELEKLPGITRPLAKKIVANRPYVALEDLKRLGVPAQTIEKIRPLVVVGLSMPSNHPPRPNMPPAGT